MTEMNTLENWALHAYADGELDAAGRLDIEKLLAEDPSARAALEAWEVQKQALKAAYDGVLSEPLPAATIASLVRRGPWSGHPLTRLAAAILLVVLGAVAGWSVAQTGRGTLAASLVGNAIVAHRIFTAEVKHPVEVAAAERVHLQSWLSKRVGAPFVIPDLSAEGYSLLGGRLLVAEGRPAAQLMFEDGDKRRITVFVTANPGKIETALRVEEEGKLVACYWLDGPLGFALAGEMDRTRMMSLARIVYDQLES
jgi:anti-sigma factor RsiW